MHNQSIMQHHIWKPLAYFGIDGAFWNLQKDVIISTWAILGLILIASFFISRCLKNQNSFLRFAVLQYVRTFQELLIQSIRSCPQNHLAFIASLFSFILLCNTIQIIPWFEEPTGNLNTTFALGLISFFYVHIHGILTKGFKQYLMHYVQPIFLMFPLHVIGVISSILSISFRLYGNIFGGLIISSLYASLLSGSTLLQTIGVLSGANLSMLLVFGIFEGLIQAFVFTMLTLTYLSMQILPEDDQDSMNLNITT
ncbi:ATP synthase F0 subunit A [candidate division TM6 bacterium RIFCSPHIGHO2_12_FULL_38_8]|nr:MAG: ATP synthase F0 subunit A [candidate division TM6 bacterium RIFCSPHIGHO2_12_FULL_38_8]